MALFYSIREGVASFRRARFASVASTSATVVALLVIGLFALLTYQAQQVSSWLRQRVGEVELFLEDEIDDGEAAALRAEAAAVRGVAGVEYVSQEDAQAIFQEEFGEGADVFLDGPFLPASIRVRVEPGYANPDSLRHLVRTFYAWRSVDEVVFNEPLLIKVQQNLRLLSVAGLTLGGFVVMASLFLVANTVRLSIYTRRLLIRTMKLVGATDAFVRRPFLVEGVLQGLLAGLVACGVLWGLYRLITYYVPAFRIAEWEVLALMGGGLVGAGILLGWLGSWFAVRRFLKNVALH